MRPFLSILELKRLVCIFLSDTQTKLQLLIFSPVFWQKFAHRYKFIWKNKDKIIHITVEEQTILHRLQLATTSLVQISGSSKSYAKINVLNRNVLKVELLPIAMNT